ncbi:RagB/SusD domain-containing protein [Salegentibacter sp. 24]|uniref:RagB/SusD family nutrient uptake outer membrane protein n=1 Tax=Salegentibacter sp. 24 TaxID=2183986 RepID=UPI00105E7811|nr:RagB/SusD family nutrient uptake outer membrane protein [Salegentibacter sp. 24]TDN94961.1 RagB/SusD domain-containing protein [Salegentibacter sp. 24]
MRKNIFLKLCLILSILLQWSCEDFLEVETPNHKIVSETVFNSDETAISAMDGIYNQLFRASSFGGVRETSVHILAGLSSDELMAIRPTNLELLEFYQNDVQPANTRNHSLWSSAYNVIYMTNSLIEGIETSGNIGEELGNNLKGEAKFVRAFTYFNLINLYGEVPLVLTTDYRENALVSRVSKEEIYDQILVDLYEASELLSVKYRNEDRTRVNKFASLALLARVNLYLENWPEAERLSSEVIAQSNQYEILEDLNQVFLANSKEAIWQISPIGGSGGILSFTTEGSVFIFNPNFPSLTKVALTTDLVESFENGDKRVENWIGQHEPTGYSYAFKYKDRNSLYNITEYSMVLRLAEQYLIRAEARAMQGDLSMALKDLDKIRQRAGLSDIEEVNPNIESEELLDLLMEARRKELFTEWGHRWMDLKRTGRALSVLSTKSSGFENTDILYPIPAEERMKNPNLNQNPGY